MTRSCLVFALVIVVALVLASIIVLSSSEDSAALNADDWSSNATKSVDSDASDSRRQFDRDAVDDAIRNAMQPFLHSHWSQMHDTAARKTRRLKRMPENNCQNELLQLRVAVCAVVRFESLYLLEWVAHHMHIGVEHIFVLDDNADDNAERDRTARVLAEFGDSITLTNVEDLSRFHTNASLVERIGGKEKTQFLWYTACAQSLGREYDWIANIDADEFILPHQEHAANFCLVSTLVRFAANCPQAPALMLSRRTFTYSGETRFVDEPVMARFTRAADTSTVKSLVRPTSVDFCASAHQCEYLNGVKAYNLAGHQPALPGKKNGRETSEPLFSPIFLAHYRSKSLEECVWKVARGYGWMEAKSFEFCAQTDGVRNTAGKAWAKRVQDLIA